MTTLGTMVDQLIRKAGVGIKVQNGAITALAVGSFTSPTYFLNGQYSNNSFLGHVIFRPGNATGQADYIRHVASITPSSGLVANDSNWSDSTLGTEDIYVLPPWLHPQRLIEASNFALEKLYTANIEPMSTKPVSTGLSDAGFQSSSTSFYTASGTTFSKHTTANSERVFQGLGSGRTLNAGYIMQQFAATEGEPMYVYAAVSVATGTATLIVRDATNSTAIGDTVSTSERAWMWLMKRETVPTDGSSQTVLTEVRLGVSGTTDDAYWGAQNVLFPNQSFLHLDTKWDSEYKATRLVAANLRGVSTSTNTYQARAGDYITIPQADYSLHMERAGPNPTTIRWHNDAQRHWYQYPIFIDGRRNYADFTTALTLASWTTDVPIDKDLWEAWTRAELFSMDDILGADANNPRRLARANYDAQTAAAQFRKTSVTEGRNFGNFGFKGN